MRRARGTPPTRRDSRATRQRQDLKISGRPAPQVTTSQARKIEANLVLHPAAQRGDRSPPAVRLGRAAPARCVRRQLRIGIGQDGRYKQRLQVGHPYVGKLYYAPAWE